MNRYIEYGFLDYIFNARILYWFCSHVYYTTIMKKILIGIGHVISVFFVLIWVWLAIAVMVKPSLLTTTITRFEWIVSYLWWKNYLLMWWVWFVESIPFLNIAFPWQTFMILIAWFIAQKQAIISIVVIMLACTLWDMVAYGAGIYKWNSILRHFWPTFWLTPEYIDKLKKMTHDHAHRALFASKWNSYTRWMVPFIAGTSRMKFVEFMLYNFLWSIVYAVVLVYLARLFIGNYEMVVPYVRRIWIGIIALVVIVYLVKYKKDGKTW